MSRSVRFSITARSGRCVALPRCWFPEVHCAASRQVALANSPAMHLPPVEYGCCESGGRGFDVRRGEFVQRGVRLVRNPRRIDVHQVPEDGTVRRKTCRVDQNFFERLFIVPLQFNRSVSDASSRRISPSQNFSFGREIVRNSDHRITFRQLRVLHPALLHRRENHCTWQSIGG
jgi:hypothetical protein